ncbi:MAG TPA: hypothetical protein VNF70_06045 [Pyrinomonadaceae bacterium]|nr:hypothetical protein [Pyrinomonadaceae bacterium]
MIKFQLQSRFFVGTLLSLSFDLLADRLQLSNPLLLRAGNLLGISLGALMRVLVGLKNGGGVFDLLQYLLFRDPESFNLAIDLRQRLRALL